MGVTQFARTALFGALVLAGAVSAEPVWAQSASAETPSSAPPADSLEYVQMEIRVEVPGCERESGACAYFVAQLPIFSGSQDSGAEAASAAARRLIAAQHTTEEFELPIEQFLTRRMTAWREFEREFPDAGPWFSEGRVEVLRNDERILSLESQSYEYSGGAHGMTFASGVILAAPTIEVLTLEDLFIPGYETELTRLGERAFRSARALTADADLDEEGFWFGEEGFRLNRNASLDREGLRFRFNPYEVAPFAWGPTTFVIPYSELSELIRADGPLGGGEGHSHKPGPRAPEETHPI